MPGKSNFAPEPQFLQVRLVQEPYHFLSAKDSATDTFWHVPGGTIMSRTEIERRIGKCRLETVEVFYSEPKLPDPQKEEKGDWFYSTADIQLVRDMVADNRTHSVIAAALGRTHRSVQNLCMKHKITRNRKS
jgi:hypothetical protein